MRSFVLFNRQVAFFAVVGALLLSIILPIIASAAQLTERSIALSSSSKAATGVTYEIKFKSGPVAAQAVTIDFCSNTPSVGEDCDLPSNFSAAGADNGGTIDATAQKVIVTQAVTANTQTTVTLANIVNPDVVGPIYARITTYDTAINAAAHDPSQATDANRVDEGGASILITDTIGVSGAVLESMTFCVSGQAISDGCTGTSAPTLKLGQQVGDIFALTPGTMSEGSIYTQITTNAATGAVVNLKSSTVGCGGLVRVGATNCDIGPALASDVANGDTTAKFGVKPLAATDTATDSGILQPYDPTPLTPSPYYSPSVFKMNWVVGDATGVTSTYGDPFLDTAGAPATNKNVELKFGASVINETPAGLYSANLNLIATGKF